MIKDSSPPSENRRRVFKQPSSELSVSSKTLKRPHTVVFSIDLFCLLVV